MEGGYFNAQDQINKYSLDQSTFDLVDVDRFHNTKAGTVFSYIFMWFLMILSWVWLGTDIYTCLSILVFHHWSSEEYQPYKYSIAKWIFTGCIIFQFCLLIYHWIWAIYTYRTRNIALAYVNKIAKLLYSVRSYNYFCLFNKIEQDTYFDWYCFYCYEELDNALQILIADTPRQVINILTIGHYATEGDNSSNVLENIKRIATTNLNLAIILSFMCLSIVLWSIFFIKFVWGVLLYLYVKPKLLKLKKYRTLKRYCCKVVNEKVRMLVLKNHKSKKELLDNGILEKRDIKMNPLLNSSTTTFNISSINQTDDSGGYGYNSVYDSKSVYDSRSGYDSKSRIQKPNPIHQANSFSPKVNSTFSYNDNSKLYDLVNQGNQSFESIPLINLNKVNPFSDSAKLESSQDLLLGGDNVDTGIKNSAPQRKEPSPLMDPFTNAAATVGKPNYRPSPQLRSNSQGTSYSYAPPRYSSNESSPHLNKKRSHSSFEYQQPEYVPPVALRKESSSSLTYGDPSRAFSSHVSQLHGDGHEATYDTMTHSSPNQHTEYDHFTPQQLNTQQDLGYGTNLQKPHQDNDFDYGSSSNLIEQEFESVEPLNYPLRGDLLSIQNPSSDYSEDDHLGELSYPGATKTPYPIRGLSVYGSHHNDDTHTKTK